MSLGKIDANEFVTVQKFIPVIFQKYIINDETNMDGLDTSADGLKTVGTFVLRYYYEKFEGILNILDIQGMGNVEIKIIL